MLAPNRPIRQATLRDLGLVALYDALATLAPPQTPIHLAPPATVLIEGARAAILTTQQAEAHPTWAIIAFDVAIAPLGDNPGLTPDQTSLLEEGFGDVLSADLIAQFCRHLLVWIDTWQGEGPAPVEQAARQYAAPQLEPAR